MLDTSSLSELTKACASRADFDDALRRGGSAVTIHGSLQQATEGDVENVRKQFAALHKLGFARFRETVGMGSYMEREKRGEDIGGVVESANSRVSELFHASDDPVRFSSIAAAVRETWRRRSDAQSSQIGAVQERMRAHWKAMPKATRTKLRPSLGGCELSRQVVGDVRDHVFEVMRHGFGGEDLAIRAKAEPRCHRTHLLFAGLATLNMLGTILRAEHTPAADFMKTGKDDLNDTILAAHAAYCDVYLVEDRLLTDRLDLLCNRGYALFKVMNVHNWLDY